MNSRQNYSGTLKFPLVAGLNTVPALGLARLMKINVRGNRSAITAAHPSKTITNARARIDDFIANIYDA